VLQLESTDRAEQHRSGDAAAEQLHDDVAAADDAGDDGHVSKAAGDRRLVRPHGHRSERDPGPGPRYVTKVMGDTRGDTPA
jgi:hypothetical protein